LNGLPTGGCARNGGRSPLRGLQSLSQRNCP
jgi:hypothetical protein